MAARYPVRYQRYSLNEIAKELTLKDTPFLQFFPNITDRLANIQDGEISLEDLCEQFPEIGQTMWTYVLTTDEWCPIFHAVDDDLIRSMVTRYRAPKHGEENQFYEEILYAWEVDVPKNVQILEKV